MGSELTRRAMIAGAICALARPVTAQSRAYQLVASGSSITFFFTTGGTRQSGRVSIDTAEISVDTSNLSRSRATVTADIRSISTGLVFFTEAIKSPELLDAAAHPIVRFRSRAVRLGARGRISEGAQIDGDLTLRGVERPITLDATLSRPARTPPDDLSVLFVHLSGSLNRRDYGATGYAGLADDRVDLDIRAEIRLRV